MKIVEVVAHAGHLDTIQGVAEQAAATVLWMGVDSEKERVAAHLLVGPDKRQAVLDGLRRVLSSDEHARVVILPVEAVIPAEGETKLAAKKPAAAISREELYNGVEKGANLDSNFFLLVFLSTIVAAIGLIEDNVAVIIGAMVIAPLLGPNIALALATALGDTVLMWKAVKCNLAGLSFALALSLVIALLWPVNIQSHELISRTDVGLDSVALALASGAAAVLSLVTGLSSVLVGVMVAVALLPPAATMGLMAGSGQFEHALGAGLLLAVNVVCVNLSAKLVLLMKGVKPRTWLELKKAHQSMLLYILLWLVTLAVLIAVIYLRH